MLPYRILTFSSRYITTPPHQYLFGPNPHLKKTMIHFHFHSHGIYINIFPKIISTAKPCPRQYPICLNLSPSQWTSNLPPRHHCTSVPDRSTRPGPRPPGASAPRGGGCGCGVVHCVELRMTRYPLPFYCIIWLMLDWRQWYLYILVTSLLL